ncbi:MAG: hypothetical protein JWN90_514 [Parcubacteria group bacterium]|nr:hypothetical protein [Parcubacteria group bacterium]
MKALFYAGLSLGSILTATSAQTQSGMGPWPSFSVQPLGVEQGFVAPHPDFWKKDPRELCGHAIGCIIIRVEDPDWDLVGYFLDVSRPGSSKPKWVNQFTRPLEAMKFAMMYRVGDERMTAVPFKMVFRNRATGRIGWGFGEVDLHDNGDNSSRLIHAVPLLFPDVVVETSADNAPPPAPSPVAMQAPASPPASPQQQQVASPPAVTTVASNGSGPPSQ